MRRVSTLAFLFAGYVVSAKIGLTFASVNPSVSAIWPPSGIAMAAVVLLGVDVWPAIFAGAFVANLTTAGSVVTSLGIAAGNTLEATLAAYFVARFANGRHAFDRPPDIFRFIGLAGMVATAVSATIGVTTLVIAGLAPRETYGSIWLTWWLGDLAGALLITPLVLVWTRPSATRWDRAQVLEGVLLLITLVASGLLIFGGVYAPLTNAPLAFFCIPVLVWTAFRFGQREAAVASLILASIAAWGTRRGAGPFIVNAPVEGLVMLQAFMGTMAMVAMSMAALSTAYRRSLAAAQRARVQAESANLAKDTFLAMLGHELRNPLAAITTAVHVLERVAPLDGKALRVRDIIADQVAQLARLVDDLLDVTRVTTGKIVLHRTRIDLATIVTRAVDTLAATGKTDHHRVELDVRSVWVDVDTTRLEQVVANLINNALKYTPPGGRIAVAVSHQGSQAVLRVADNGIGIAAHVLPTVFDLFTQGDRGPDRSQGGLGIGLTLVKRLVELHGGSVEAASDGPGRGSVFTVRLMAVAPARPADTLRERTGDARSRRVLIIEDQPDAREMLKLSLELAGHEVFEAATGPRGIEMMASVQPEVAIIDIGLPGCDGYEVARQTRLMPHGRDIYLVALTGYGQPEDRLRAEEAGFGLHLVKPVEPDELAGLVASAPTRRTESSLDVRANT
jgi:signal transduction histidine kinase/ActR/RegA family two-component response regulator